MADRVEVRASLAVRCLACGRLCGRDRRRGLCRPCYRQPRVREQYARQARGSWARDGWAHWSALDCCRLHEMFTLGLSDREIAANLGRTVDAVTKRRQRFRLKVSPIRQATHRR